MPFFAFVKIDSIEGDSKRKGFERQIELVGIEHKITQPLGGKRRWARCPDGLPD